MNRTEFGMKELYSVSLKTLDPIHLDGRQLEAGEVVAFFDKIQIATLSSQNDFVAARGGYDNRAQVIWDEPQGILFHFSQGIFSKLQFALLSNAQLSTVEKNTPLSISTREIGETDELGDIKLKYIPTKIYIYNQETGEKITGYTVEENICKLGLPYTNLIIDYTFTYLNGADKVVVGEKLLNGYVELQGKTRVKDDKSGHVRTGIIRIPKLKLLSDLSIRLGEGADPVVADFKALGIPTGYKGTKVVAEFLFLSDDIDVDI